MDTFELFSLTSKLTLDTAQFDRAYTDSRGKMKTLAGEVNKLETAAKSGAGGTESFGSALKGLLPNLSALGGPAGAIGIVTAGIGLYIAAIEKAATGVWDITKRFSDLGSELQDMSDQVNFSVETLGTFSGVGKSIGVEVEQLSTGLVTFQKNLNSGNDALKALGVTSKDNETALRQTFQALSQVNDKTLQSALAAEIFGKSGKAMLSVVKATGGNFDEAQDKLRKWNVLMSDQAVAIADEFGDKLGELGLRFQGIGNTIATETAPAFIAAFDQIAAALDANVIEWKWWGEKAGNVIVNSTALVAGFAHAVSEMNKTGSPIKFLIDWEAGFEEARKKMDAKRAELLQPIPEGMFGGRIPGPTIDWNPGGKDKVKKAAREKEDPIIRLTEQYEDRLRHLTPMTAEAEVRQELLNKAYANSSKELKEALIATGRLIDSKRKEIEAAKAAKEEHDQAQKAYEAFAQQQFETLHQLRDGTMSAFQEASVAMLKFMSVTTPMQRWWLQFDAILIDIERHLKELPADMTRLSEEFPLDIKFPEKKSDSEIAEHAGEAANREAGLPPEMRESSLLKWRRLVEDLAYDITNTIDRAITRGFEDGIGAGIKEFALGILEMARHEVLNELAKAMRRALSGGAEGEKGSDSGGWLATLISTGMTALSSLFGGGGKGWGDFKLPPITSHAGGGFMFPNEWSMVGERGPELVKAGSRGASVMNNSESMAFAGMGGLTINQTIQVPSMYMAGNRQTQTQAFRGLQQAAQRGYSLRG